LVLPLCLKLGIDPGQVFNTCNPTAFIMPYDFDFDLSRLPRQFFGELSRVAEEKQLHRRFGLKARELAERFRLSEATGLDVQTLLFLMEDLTDVQIMNRNHRDRFVATAKRALFLPHCARAHMDSRCEAEFDSGVPMYRCAHCTEECLVNQATKLGEERGYAVYVVPGGSCIPKIIKAGGFEGIVGVACGMELMPALKVIQKYGLPGQAVPLIKNGCANTAFNMNVLAAVL
jgi:hypothetical protein